MRELNVRESFDKFGKFPWNSATIHLMTRHLERSTLRTPSGQFQPERTHSSRLIVIWSRLSQSLQNTHWQWLLHLTRISSHLTKFLSLRTERNHTGPNSENRVDEESIYSPIRSFVTATVDLWDGALSWWKSIFLRANLASNVNYASFLAEIWPKGVRRVDLSRCRVIKWIVAPFHENLPNLSNDPRIPVSLNIRAWMYILGV